MSRLGEREQEAVRDLLAGLERDVPVRLVLGPEETPITVIVAGRDIDFGAETRALLEQVAALSDRVTLTVEETTERGRWPEITVGGGLRYHGLPWGYELSAIVGAIVEAGKVTSTLSTDSLTALATLQRPVEIEVYVTPTCPHCPPAVLLAYRCALASPNVTAVAVEATEFAADADRHGVVSVPAIVIDGHLRYTGAVPEHAFVQRLLAAGE